MPTYRAHAEHYAHRMAESDIFRAAMRGSSNLASMRDLLDADARGRRRHRAGNSTAQDAHDPEPRQGSRAPDHLEPRRHRDAPGDSRRGEDIGSQIESAARSKESRARDREAGIRVVDRLQIYSHATILKVAHLVHSGIVALTSTSRSTEHTKATLYVLEAAHRVK